VSPLEWQPEAWAPAGVSETVCETRTPAAPNPNKVVAAGSNETPAMVAAFFRPDVFVFTELPSSSIEVSAVDFPSGLLSDLLDAPPIFSWEL
jgi:hypothetical protein